MFFITRYGIEYSIREEPLALNHIDTYTIIPINMNFSIHEIDDKGMTHEPIPSLEEVPDYLLDEWATTFQFDLA